jgi:hypothetical protein
MRQEQMWPSDGAPFLPTRPGPGGNARFRGPGGCCRTLPWRSPGRRWTSFQSVPAGVPSGDPTYPSSSQGLLLRIAIRVDVCPADFRAVAPPSCSLKTAMPSPRRERPIYQGKHASRGSHPVRDRPSRRSASARTESGDVAKPDGCDRDGRRRTGGDRQDAWILGRQDAAGEGTGSRFFRTGRMAGAEVEGCRGTSST